MLNRFGGVMFPVYKTIVSSILHYIVQFLNVTLIYFFTLKYIYKNTDTFIDPTVGEMIRSNR